MVSPKQRRAVSSGLRDIKPLVKPIVEPVITRLDRHEELLQDLKAALEVQFRRTAQIEAQLDQLLAAAKSRG